MKDFVSVAKELLENQDAGLHLDDLVSVIRFNEHVESVIGKKGVLDARIAEAKYERNITAAMRSLERKSGEFGHEWIKRPTIHASARNMYIRGQFRVYMKSDPSVCLHVPIYYTYGNWKLLEEGNVESELATLISGTIVQALKDPRCTIINPLNFDKFSVYNIEVTDYVYDQWNVVLEVNTDKIRMEIGLYYVWDFDLGAYRRVDESSELAQKHNAYTDLIRKLTK